MIQWFKNLMAEAEEIETLAAKVAQLEARNKSLLNGMATASDEHKNTLESLDACRSAVTRADRAIAGLHQQIGQEKQAHAKTLKLLRQQTEADILATGLRAVGMLPTTEREGAHRERMHNLVSRLESIDKKLEARDIRQFAPSANPFLERMRQATGVSALAGAGAVHPGIFGKKLDDGGVL